MHTVSATLMFMTSNIINACDYHSHSSHQTTVTIESSTPQIIGTAPNPLTILTAHTQKITPTTKNPQPPRTHTSIIHFLDSFIDDTFITKEHLANFIHNFCTACRHVQLHESSALQELFDSLYLITTYPTIAQALLENMCHFHNKKPLHTFMTAVRSVQPKSEKDHESAFIDNIPFTQFDFFAGLLSLCNDAIMLNFDEKMYDQS